jgi:PAS domain S-box-containing protein
MLIDMIRSECFNLTADSPSHPMNGPEAPDGADGHKAHAGQTEDANDVVRNLTPCVIGSTSLGSSSAIRMRSSSEGCEEENMSHPLRILSIEDDPKDAELIQNLLETEHIACQVTRVESQAALVAALGESGIDLILADYSLPSFDGISALKLAMKACPEVPFIFVSGTLGEEVAIEALKIGATDYVLKTRLSRLVPSVLRALREATERAERKRAEESLRQSQTYLAEAQRLSATGSFGWNVSSGEIYWSEETHKIFEYEGTVTPTLELVFRRIHPDDRDLVRQTIDRASAARENLDNEHRLLMPDGSVKHLHVLARVLEHSSGNLEYVGAVMDVTAAKRAEETLRQSEAYLAEAQRLSNTGSWAWAPTTGEIGYWSEENYRVHGFDPRGGQPRFEAFLQRVHPDDQAMTRTTLEAAAGDKSGFEFDYRIVHPGGKIRDIHLLGHPVLNPSGDLVEFVGTVMDVTERKRAKEERERLRQVQADLAHINRVTTMGELTASLAHEIKQPISAAVTDAKTCLRWLGRDNPDLTEARDAASRMVKDVMRAADIISRISLVFQKSAPQRELVNVNELIREMFVLLRSEANRYSISIRTELAEDLPKIMADRIQLQQVFMNLMLNGIDAMNGAIGRGELTIKSEARDAQLLISVCDTGVGLAPEVTDHIFSPFFTTKDKGTGMGLPISRSIIESHGGRLWATSGPGTDATFQFTLPAMIAVRT